MIIILGDSASGKSTIERMLVKKGYNRIISYTSRPKRDGESDHIDYHFLTADQFLYELGNGFFAEDTVYNGWHYGVAKKDMEKDSVVVVERNGFNQLKEWAKIVNTPIISFYIKVPERDRVIRMMKRGDNVMESFRRIISDQGSFAGVERDVDYVIRNEWIAEAVVDVINAIKNHDK